MSSRPRACRARTGSYTLYGRNLPGGQKTDVVAADGKPLESLAVEIELPADQSVENLDIGSIVEPDESGVDGYAYRLTTPNGLTNSVLIGYATAPVVVEHEPNDDPAHPQAVTLPCEYVGQFHPQTDRDWITFDAKKGEALWMEVFSQRLGLPTDPYLLVQQVTKNDKGEEQVKDVQGVDDFRENPRDRFGSVFDMKTDDPAFRFVAPADGTYRVLVRNLSNYSRPDPRLVYRLAIHPAKPDFRLVIDPHLLPFSPDVNQNPPTVWSPLLRKGGTELVDVMLFRREGFDGEVQVVADGLPEGVTSAPVTIAAGQERGVLVLSAAENAPESMSLITILGKAKIGEADVTRPARPAAMIWGGRANQIAPRYRLARNFAIAVSGGETAAFFIDAGANKVVEMCKAGKVEVPIKLVRRGDFKGVVQLAPSSLPPNVKPAAITIAADKAEGKLEIPLPANVPEGSYTFALVGSTQVSYSRDPEALKVVTDRKTAVDKIVTELAAAAKAATEAKAAAEKRAADMTVAMQKAREAAQAANKAAEEAAAKAKAAAEAKAAADKAAADMEAQLKAAAEAKAAAEKAAAQADAKSKEAVGVQQNVAKELDAATKKAKPANINVASPSPTVTLKVTAAPVTLGDAPAAMVKQGASVEVPLSVSRLYGFADVVQVTTKVPDGAKAVKVANVDVPADQAQAMLKIETGADTPPGKHVLVVTATAKYNGQNLTVSREVPLTVEAAAAAEAAK